MIEIEVLLLPQRIRKRGRIDPSASFDRIRSDIVKALKLGDPDDYTLSLAPKSGKLSPRAYQPSPGDLFILTKQEELGKPAFTLSEDQ
jgi:hypothetical protein